MRKILLGIAAFLTVLAGGYGLNELGAGVNTGERVVMNEVATTTISSAFLVNDYKSVEFTIASTAASGTYQFACSNQEDVSFSSAASATNRWDYVLAVDLEDGSNIDGDTGVTTTNATYVRQFEINSNAFYSCAAMWTRTAGTSSIYMRPANNQ